MDKYGALYNVVVYLYCRKSGVVRAANGSIIWEYWNIFFHLYFFQG